MWSVFSVCSFLCFLWIWAAIAWCVLLIHRKLAWIWAHTSIPKRYPWMMFSRMKAHRYLSHTKIYYKMGQVGAFFNTPPPPKKKNTYTPPKTNMEPKIAGFQVQNLLFRGVPDFQVPAVSFPGCIEIYLHTYQHPQRGAKWFRKKGVKSPIPKSV